ncbi:universal stress protein [Streptomyces chartreusis]
MSRTVTVGLDGFPESLTAADWAAREERLRGLPLRLLHAWQWRPHACAPLVGATLAPAGSGPQREWADGMTREAATRLASVFQACASPSTDRRTARTRLAGCRWGRRADGVGPSRPAATATTVPSIPSSTPNWRRGSKLS